MRSKSITVIGAGPAGALLSIYLARRGYEVTVYERRPDLRRVRIPAGRSINLALANRGMHALAEVGLMDRVKPLLIPISPCAGAWSTPKADPLGSSPTGTTPTR